MVLFKRSKISKVLLGLLAGALLTLPAQAASSKESDSKNAKSSKSASTAKNAKSSSSKKSVPPVKSQAMKETPKTVAAQKAAKEKVVTATSNSLPIAWALFRALSAASNRSGRKVSSGMEAGISIT